MVRYLHYIRLRSNTSPRFIQVSGKTVHNLVTLSAHRSPEFAETPIQGRDKHEFGDPNLPHQLWVVTHVSTDNTYFMQNACGKTFVDLWRSESTTHLVIVTSTCYFNVSADATPVHGIGFNGQFNQKWVIEFVEGEDAYT